MVSEPNTWTGGRRRMRSHNMTQGVSKYIPIRDVPFNLRDETKYFLDNSDTAVAPFGCGMVWQRFWQTRFIPLQTRYHEYWASGFHTDAGNTATQCPKVVSLFAEISSKQWKLENNTDAYFNQIFPLPKSSWISHTWRRLLKIRKLKFKLCYEIINTRILASRCFTGACCLHLHGGYVASRKDEVNVCTDGAGGGSCSIQENQENPWT